MPADLLFTGGPVYTPDAAGRRMVRAAGPGGRPATAVAVTGERITAVGDAADPAVRDLAGPGTEVFDLRGRALLPGFQDAHVHPAFAGLTMIGCNLIGARTLDEALGRIDAYARANPGQEWIAGGGWRMEWFDGGTPSRQALDAVVGDRPAYLVNRDFHGAWASSRALALAGIDAAAPDPADGRIEREAGGGPQGTLHEGAASLVGAWSRRPPWPSGSTGCCWPSGTCTSAASPPGRTPSSGTTSARPTRWRPTWRRRPAAGSPPGCAARCGGTATATPAQLPEILARRERGHGRPLHGRHRQDHAGRGAGELHRRPDRPVPGPRRQHDRGARGPGTRYVDPEALARYVTALDAHGFQVHLHAIGDRAVREALDAVAAAAGGQRPGDAAATGTTSPTCRSSSPATCPASPGWA